MNRPDFLQVFARHRAGAPTITGPGLASRELFTLEGNDPSILYNMDMSYAAPFCLGIALAGRLPRVVALEGDGSLLTGLGVLSTIGRYRPANLTLIALDNESYGTFGHGEMDSATAARTSLEGVGRACGIERFSTVRTLAEAEKVLPRALREPGPWLVVAKLENSGDTDPRYGQVPPDVIDAGLAFYRQLQEQPSHDS